VTDANGEGQSKRFTTTEWSLVLAAAATDSTASREALESLCGRYWYPVYAEVRFAGNDRESARDLTQGFFTQLLERKALAMADPERGKFRNFLKTSLKNYLSHQAERNRAQKRGGGTSSVFLELDAAEKQYALEMAHTRTPEKMFDRRWAHTMLQQVLDRLREEMDQAGSLEQFERLAPFFMGRGETTSYRNLAIRWNTTEAAIKMAVLRLRRKFGKLLRMEVAHTVGDRRDVSAEIRFLLSTLET
jgi:RNA polymerase sigma-70 factor (ECF subfamily)